MKIKMKSLKRSVALALICCISILPVRSYATSQTQDDTKQYIVIYEDGEKHSVETCTMTETEAIKMKHETEVLVVEEDSYVYGSSDSQSDLDDFYQKQVLEKNIEERSAKNSDVEWNIQAIKADNIDLEIATSPSATINVATGPAISINVATGSAISTNKVKVALIDSGIDYTSDIDVFNT